MDIVINLDSVNRLITELVELKNPDRLLREIATTLSAEVHERIHEKGLAADGSGIGTYSDNYFKYTRKKYNREEPKSKVVFSLTRKMENSFTFGDERPPIKTASGYGLGFIGSAPGNVSYSDIVGWLEIHFGKEVYALTSSEEEMVRLISEDYVTRNIVDAD